MTDRPDVVQTSTGAVRGEVADDGFAVFRGMRFAAPPTGGRRFAPPAPLEPWTDVVDATAFGAASIQPVPEVGAASGGFGSLFGPGGCGVSEDCLFLNVFTPGLDTARRPVMVWIHGGAFRLGTGASPGYDGTALARRGDVVVVTLNYRLGLLGFLHSPALGSTNAGLLDQIAALEWVQREIAAFGGDPEQVTVFGESAGAKSIECMLAMPAAAGLFHRAILQSTYQVPMDADGAAQHTAKIVEAAGIDDIEQLRTLDLEALLAAETTVTGGFLLGGGGPIVDGDTLPVDPTAHVASGARADVDAIVGTTLDEARLFGAGFGDIDEDSVRGELSRALDLDDDAAAVALDTYRKAHAELGERTDVAAISAAVRTDQLFRQHSIRLADTLAAHNESTHAYLLTFKSVAMGGALGACHGIDLPFVFGNLTDGMGSFVGDSPEARALVDVVQEAWLSFARNGTTGGSWDRYGDRRRTMVLGAESECLDDPLGAVRELWS